LTSRLEGAGKCAMENASMPCLDKAFAKLKPLLPSLQRERVVRVQGGVMPCSMRLLLGIVHIHTANGALVACLKDEQGREVLYTRCFCECKDKNIMETTLAPILGSTEEWSFPWVMLDQSSYGKLIGRLSAGKQAGSKDAGGGKQAGSKDAGGGKRQRREATP